MALIGLEVYEVAWSGKHNFPWPLANEWPGIAWSGMEMPGMAWSCLEWLALFFLGLWPMIPDVAWGGLEWHGVAWSVIEWSQVA